MRSERKDKKFNNINKLTTSKYLLYLNEVNYKLITAPKPIAVAQQDDLAQGK